MFQNKFVLEDGGVTNIGMYDASIAKEKEPTQRSQSSGLEPSSYGGNHIDSSYMIVADMLNGGNDNDGKPYINEDGSLNVDLL